MTMAGGAQSMSSGGYGPRPAAPHRGPAADPSGAWVELLGDVAGRDVVLVDSTGGRAAERLVEAGARVRGPGWPSPGRHTAHAMAVAGVPLTGERLDAAQRTLAPGGLLLLVAANRRSPIAWWDALRGRSATPRGSLRKLRKLAGARGLPVRAEYGLLRSCTSPSTILALDHPALAATVLAASNTLNRGLRHRAVAALTWLARRGRAEQLVPGLALLCSARPLEHDPVMGRIGALGSAEVKVLFGRPLRYVDKTYTSADRAGAEADALTEACRAWPELVPRLWERLGPLRNRVGWVTGHTLALDRLTAAEGERWVLEAAAVLGELHRRLGVDDGQPALVHGDFWLGNVLVDDERQRIVAVIDWVQAHRGDAGTDLAFLVDEHVTRAALPETAARRLREAGERAYRYARRTDGPSPRDVPPDEGTHPGDPRGRGPQPPVTHR